MENLEELSQEETKNFSGGVRGRDGKGCTEPVISIELPTGPIIIYG